MQNEVTWLECAAASVCWSTMLVYYMEVPFGHLMGEDMGFAQGRTHVRGNLFSFSMPWQDMEACCAAAIASAGDQDRAQLQELQAQTGVPHSEEVLALLVNVHVRGGAKDLALHLKGLTMRVAVVEKLIGILRDSGYPGYEEQGLNSESNVSQRMKERYRDRYGEASFTPAAILENVNVKKRDAISIVQDKSATPSEPQNRIADWEMRSRPNHIVAERSVSSQANIHENYQNVFAQFGTVKVATGQTFTEQFHPWYLGMAYPYTIPLAVGGYDVPNVPRWRRPENEDVPWPRAHLATWLKELSGDHDMVGPACSVRLFDLTRGLPQRIEGQYRRHWGFAPGLWNLYFREQIKLGLSLSAVSRGKRAEPFVNIEHDAAM